LSARRTRDAVIGPRCLSVDNCASCRDRTNLPGQRVAPIRRV